MKYRNTLAITSLLSVILFGLHWIDEISRGLEKGTTAHLGGIVILVVWSYAALVLRDHWSGYGLMLLGGILGIGVLLVHMQGAGITGGRIANTSGIFFWVMTLVALGVTSSLSVILALHALWDSVRGRRLVNEAGRA
jgi:hypothetical protein